MKKTTFNTIDDLYKAVETELKNASENEVRAEVEDYIIDCIDKVVMKKYTPHVYERRAEGGLNDRNNLSAATNVKHPTYGTLIESTYSNNAIIHGPIVKKRGRGRPGSRSLTGLLESDKVYNLWGQSATRFNVWGRNRKYMTYAKKNAQEVLGKSVAEIIEKRFR